MCSWIEFTKTIVFIRKKEFCLDITTLSKLGHVVNIVPTRRADALEKIIKPHMNVVCYGWMSLLLWSSFFSKINYCFFLVVI